MEELHHAAAPPLLTFTFIPVCRFESLEPEMNSQASRVAVVNQVSRQLIHSGHPSEKEIKARQDKLNTRWGPQVSLVPVVLLVISHLQVPPISMVLPVTVVPPWFLVFLRLFDTLLSFCPGGASSETWWT